MKRTFLLLLTAAVFLIFSPPINPAQADDDLLTNGGFEGHYQAWAGIEQVRVADGWIPFWAETSENESLRPEYKGANPTVNSEPIYANRVRSGRNAQQWFTAYATAFAGVYQRVDVVPNSTVRLSAWTHAWSSDDNSNPNQSQNPAWVRQRVGIDPSGGTDPTSANVVWSMPGNFIDNWGQLSVEAKAQGEHVTVYLAANPNFARPHNDIYYDDARLIVVSFPLPAPAASTGPAPVPTPDPLLRGLITGRGVLPGQQGISSSNYQHIEQVGESAQPQFSLSGYSLIYVGIALVVVLFFIFPKNRSR